MNVGKWTPKGDAGNGKQYTNTITATLTAIGAKWTLCNTQGTWGYYTGRKTSKRISNVGRNKVKGATQIRRGRME